MLGGIRRLFRFGTNSSPPAGSPPAAAPDLLDIPVLQLSPVDAFTLRDACEGVQIFGAVGSGKTSGSGRALALSFLRLGFGGLVLTAKPDECDLWRGYAAEAGRSDDLVVFNPSEPWRFNFLEYEVSRPGRGAGLTENVLDLFMRAIEAGGRQQGTSQDPFWEDALKELLRNAIQLVVMATGELSLADLKEVVDSSANSAAQAADAAWREESGCFQGLRAAEARATTREQREDYQQIESYWMQGFPELDDKPRNTIKASFTAVASPLLRHPMRELLCTGTNLTPEASLEGKIIILDLPVKEYGAVGTFAQVLFKQAWQKSVERRDLRRNGAPVFLWADEAQYFLTGYDPSFLQTARSSRACTVYLTQNLPNYYAALDRSKGRDQAESLLGNLSTKIFHANGDIQTNRWAADTIAQTWQTRTSSNSGGSDSDTSSVGGQQGNRSFGDTRSWGVSASEQMAYQVLPQEFTTLRQGGPANGFAVDAILFKAGRVWNATGTNYLPVAFPQRDT